MRALLDTNVLTAGILGVFRQSTRPPAQIQLHLEEQKFRLITSDHILEELQHTLAQEWFTDRITATSLQSAMERLRRNAEIVQVTTSISGVAGHWQDDLVLAAAVSGNAKFLVTGDAEFLLVRSFQGIMMTSPASFLQILEQQ